MNMTHPTRLSAVDDVDDDDDGIDYSDIPPLDGWFWVGAVFAQSGPPIHMLKTTNASVNHDS